MRTKASANPRLARQMLLALGAVCALSLGASGQVLEKRLPAQAQGVELRERFGQRVPMNLVFTEADAKPLAMAEVLEDGLPVVLALVYYDCPIVCPVVMRKMLESFNDLDYTIGDEFNVLIVSFDATETPTHASSAKAQYTALYNRRSPKTDRAWSFCVADQDTIDTLTSTVGFMTNRLPGGEFAHPVGVTVLSPEGEVAAYFHGFDYPARDMKLALLDASNGGVARSFGDRLLHFCYRYDPEAGSYSMHAMNVMRLAGVVTVIGLIALIGGLLTIERLRKRSASRTPADIAPSQQTLTDAQRTGNFPGASVPGSVS